MAPLPMAVSVRALRAAFVDTLATLGARLSCLAPVFRDHHHSADGGWSERKMTRAWTGAKYADVVEWERRPLLLLLMPPPQPPSPGDDAKSSNGATRAHAGGSGGGAYHLRAGPKFRGGRDDPTFHNRASVSGMELSWTFLDEDDEGHRAAEWQRGVAPRESSWPVGLLGRIDTAEEEETEVTEDSEFELSLFASPRKRGDPQRLDDAAAPVNASSGSDLACRRFAIFRRDGVVLLRLEASGAIERDILVEGFRLLKAND